MPVALAERRGVRLALLCALYVAQGIPFGFVTITLAGYFAGEEVSTDRLGDFLALTSLPWAFKWALGPLIDRFSRSVMGRRRPWILAAQGMMVLTATILLLASGPLGDDLALLSWLVLAHNVFVALQDVSVDALAVDLLPEKERGVANGLMYGSSYLGMVIGGAGLSTVLGTYGLRGALLAQVLVLAGIMLLPLLLRERAGDRLLSPRTRPRQPGEEGGSMALVLRNLGRAFAGRSPRLGVLLAGSVMIGSGALSVIGAVLVTQRLGWDPAEYGQVLGGVPVFFGLGGSVAGGWLADRLGRRRMVAVSSLLLAASWFAFAAAEPYWGERNLIVAFACTGALFVGTMSAALFALFMDVSWPRVAATQFTAYMALLNLSRTVGAKLAGPVSGAFGMTGAYIAFGVLQCLLVLLLLPLDPRQNRRELGGLDRP